MLDLVETGARSRFTWRPRLPLAAAARRVPDESAHALRARAGRVGHRSHCCALSNLGTAELWTGDSIAAEKHLRAAVDTTQWSGLLLPHLNAAAQSGPAAGRAR